MNDSYFMKDHSDSNSKNTEDDIVTVLFVVLGNYFVFHGYIGELFTTRLAAVNIFIYNDIYKW